MKHLMVSVAALLVGACVSQENAPLLFGQTHSLGVNVGATPAGTPEIAVGFKDLDIAIIPTVSPLSSDGLIQGHTGADVDAYSTFGQFESDAGGTGVGLGKFFATGIAARRLADGFACDVSTGTAVGCKP